MIRDDNIWQVNRGNVVPFVLYEALTRLCVLLGWSLVHAES